ncbi:hypothetical protein CY35_19G071600 [Sphagnum magellanicum]|nr:hypothetical protein CY35_19G071600 [Sphagnum magellanicum]
MAKESFYYDFDKRYYSVHQLYPDLSTPKHDHKLTLIFFHSTSDDLLAWENTWIQRTHPEVCWPRDWLPKPPEDQGLGTDIRVLSVAYPVPRKSIKEWVKHMMELLICSSTWQLQHSHNIILVGHKFGGILIKSLLNEVNKVAHRKKFADVAEKEAKDSCEAFQHNLSGIMFYSVPHFMTKKDIQIVFQEKKDIFKAFSDCGSEPGILDSESRILESTSLHKPTAWRVFSHQIEAINEDFEDSIAHYHTKICVISHGLTMPKEASTHNQQKMKLPASDLLHIIEDADDWEVCKPINNRHASYTIFLKFVDMVCKQKALPVIPTANVISDCVAFSYQVLCDATKNFDPTISKIGEGSFGTVFKAIINHQGRGREVAIKRLSYDGVHTAAMNEEFKQEIWRVSTVRHKNIVSLLGYCLPEANSPLLMVTPLHSSLFKHLYEGEKPWLNWQARFKIAMGVAEGLAYLHDGAPERLIHCDIKPGNILFDPNTFQPYIADFGTARFMQRSESMVGTSRLRGTRGFMDPHFQRYMMRSVMVDVYSFGVLLFVLVSGEQDVVRLLELAKDEDVVDEEIINQGDFSYNELEIHRVLAVARQCTKFEPSDRPTMSKVTMMLNGDHPSESLSSFVVHKNIISPFGYNTKQVDFLSQMATPTYLSLSEELRQLYWKQRLKIAIGVAEALAYLHDNAPQCVVHGNINSGCIVFDPNTFQAYITEFEFARFMQRSESESWIQVSTSTGSQGYIDPHFQRSTSIST